ncbi:ferredoxin [Treponema sp.]
MKKVWLDESDDECISCGNCEAICPEVFEVPDKMIVKAGVDLNAIEAKVLEAIDSCPTDVIKYE